MWQPIGTVPVNTWVLARAARDDGGFFIPAVVRFDTNIDRWVDPGDVAYDGSDSIYADEFHFNDDWQPVEWHPLPEENEVVEPLALVAGEIAYDD